MDSQLVLEKTIHKLVDEFVKNPYVFFTEADAVSIFHQFLIESTEFNSSYKTSDGYEINTIHREFPTFFRFDGKNPAIRLEDNTGASRGHYDMAILKPEFIMAHKADTVANRDIKTQATITQSPFEAVLEFKLHNNGWSKGRVDGVKAELGKLSLTLGESPLCYLIVFQRYRAPNLNRWNRWWDTVKQAAEQSVQIRSIVAIQWLTVKNKPEIFSFGPWLEKYPIS